MLRRSLREMLGNSLLKNIASKLVPLAVKEEGFIGIITVVLIGVMGIILSGIVIVEQQSKESVHILEDQKHLEDISISEINGFRQKLYTLVYAEETNEVERWLEMVNEAPDAKYVDIKYLEEGTRKIRLYRELTKYQGHYIYSVEAGQGNHNVVNRWRFKVEGRKIYETSWHD